MRWKESSASASWVVAGTKGDAAVQALTDGVDAPAPQKGSIPPVREIVIGPRNEVQNARIILGLGKYNGLVHRTVLSANLILPSFPADSDIWVYNERSYSIILGKAEA